MQRAERLDVLVVGAGPVGMLSALLLARAGLRVKIIDQESRTASRTYACALHPPALKLLDRYGLISSVLSLGRRVGGAAFYEGEARRAQIQLAQLSHEFPFVLVLSQSAFESVLEDKLRHEARVTIEWNHRLADLRPEHEGMIASVEKLAASAKGYIVPEMEWSVEKTETLRASFVLGADGPNSFVAKSLGLEFETVGQPEFYAVYEFGSDWTCVDELRVVLDPATTSVLWPLPQNRFRWSFQLLQEHLRDFPAKERSAVIVGGPDADEANRAFVQKLARERAPWFKGNILELGWSADVEFEHRLARRYGQEHCWLAGDAAHQTSPAGMQSMNAGLLEAELLSSTLIRILREHAPVASLETYNQRCREQWRRLLGISGAPKARAKADPWVKQHSGRILSCLPGSGDDLTGLLSQVELESA